MVEAETCDGRPLRQVCKTWKNVVLVSLLSLAFVSILLASRCASAASLLERDAFVPDGGMCDHVVDVHPRHAYYAGLALLLLWCCCPCFKMDCDVKELEKRSCFLKALQRRRRHHAKRAKALREGIALADMPPDEDEENEP